MDANEKIAARRGQRGLSEGEVARAAGISISEYMDMEHYPEEAVDVASVGQMKRVCAALEMDFLSLFEIRCAFCEGDQPSTDEYRLPRNLQVSRRREGLGLSRELLGDRLGFYEQAIEDMESDPEFLESWSVDLVRALALELNLPTQVLLAVQCRTCGR